MRLEIGDEIRVIEVDEVDASFGLKKGEVLTIVEFDFENDYPIIATRHGHEWRYVLSFEQVELVKEEDPFESRIKEMQVRLDDVALEIESLNREEESLTRDINYLREAQRIMKEV